MLSGVRVLLLVVWLAWVWVVWMWVVWVWVLGVVWVVWGISILFMLRIQRMILLVQWGCNRAIMNIPLEP